MQKISDLPLVDCPACGEATLSKMVSAAGFRLKGSGWYESDFKGGGKIRPQEGAGDKDSGGGHACGSGGCAACS
jgi:predicted nucleic acid-binding Zn ribbon protein